MDLETYAQKDGNLVPYCVCVYEGNVFKSFYLSDYAKYQVMLVEAIRLMLDEYDGSKPKVYLHNLSNLDGIFLLKHLPLVGKVTPIINSVFIEVSKEVKVDGNKQKAVFSLTSYDSYQMLL